MRYSRIARIIMRFFLLILASTMSFVSFLGGYSALLILSDEDNIDIDVDFEGDLFVDPTLFEIDIEFTVYNEGYFDLEDLKLELKLEMIYYNKSYGIVDAFPVGIMIYDGKKSFDTIPAGTQEKNTISIKFEDLIGTVDWAEIILNADYTKELAFQAEDIKISARYSLGLIKFTVEIEELDLGDYEL